MEMVLSVCVYIYTYVYVYIYIYIYVKNLLSFRKTNCILRRDGYRPALSRFKLL